MAMNRKQRRVAAKSERKQAPTAALLDEAARLHGAGRLEEAAIAYRRVLEVAPSSVDALMNLGTTLATLGFADEAIARLRSGARLIPNSADVHHDLGVALTQLGRLEESVVALRRAVTLAPNASASLDALGHALTELGRREEAIAALHRAIALDPVAPLPYYHLHLALHDDRNLEPAIDALNKAVAYDPGFVQARFCLAVALDRAGKAKPAAALFDNLHADKSVYRGAVDSYRYAKAHATPATRFLATTREMLLLGLREAKIDGSVLEFGVRYGTSTRWIAGAVEGKVHGFDSFQGLPDPWHILPPGAYSTHGSRPEVPSNVELHVGLFEDSLPPFLAREAGPVRYMNVDCDLYSSTRTVLRHVGDRVVPGTVIVFDEYLVNDAWREDEFKAFQEAVTERGWRYEYLAFSLTTGQAVVRIL